MMTRAGIALVSVAVPVLGAYDPDSALTYAYVSTATMCSYPKLKDNRELENWQCGPACGNVSGMVDVQAVMPDAKDSNDAFAIVGKLNDECIVAFRGTSDLNGWIQDLNSLKLVDLSKSGVPCSFNKTSCMVGEGFVSNYVSVAKFIKGNLTKIGCGKQSSMTVIGHSLGAAEAAIAMFDLKTEGWDITRSYTFGQPRVGDATFAAAFEEAFGSTGLYRITKGDDPVPHLPLEKWGFQHVTTEIYYKGDVSQGYQQCVGGEDAKCANSRSRNLPFDVLECAKDRTRCPHLTYMANEKMIRMDESSCKGYEPEALTLV